MELSEGDEKTLERLFHGTDVEIYASDSFSPEEGPFAGKHLTEFTIR